MTELLKALHMLSIQSTLRRLCVSSLGGLDLSAVGQIYSPVSCSADTEDSTEPYTTERLSRLRGGYIQLTQVFTALDIDFNNVQVLNSVSI